MDPDPNPEDQKRVDPVYLDPDSDPDPQHCQKHVDPVDPDPELATNLN
jgi:hypothetical protein